MAKKKQRNPEKTKEAIMKAAVDEFVEHGYHGARMQAIADNAKVNKAMIHYYYKSKDVLYNSIITEGKEMIILYLSAIENDDKPVREKMEEIMDAYIKVFSDPKGYFRVIVYEVVRGGKEVMKNIVGSIDRIPFNPVTGKIYKYFDKKMKQKEIKKVNILQLIVSIVSQIAPVYFAKGIFKEVVGKMGIDGMAFDKLVHERKKFVLDLMMNGLEPDIKSKK